MGDARPILIFAPSPAGGLAEHVHYQAGELCRRGHAVEVLCRTDFVKPQATAAYRQHRRLLTFPGASVPARLVRAALSVANWYVLAWRILRVRPRFVLLEANTEFLSPLWFLPHWLLRLTGTVYLANFHDPVRGPERGWRRWTHALAIRLGYLPLEGGLIHGPPPPRAYLPLRLVIREAPFGQYTDLVAAAPDGGARSRLGIPREAFVVLAFGHVADRKNIDLAIEALADVPEAHLVIAGPAGSGADRPIDFYRALAAQLGIAERVHFVAGFIPENEISGLFTTSDAVALTYERRFVSQSAVLQIAALFDRPVLASGGAGPLRQTVDAFGLGVTVEPDSAVAIAAGLRELVARRPGLSAQFARYRATMSWRANVDRLLEVAGLAGA